MNDANAKQYARYVRMYVVGKNPNKPSNIVLNMAVENAKQNEMEIHKCILHYVKALCENSHFRTLVIRRRLLKMHEARY